MSEGEQREKLIQDELSEDKPINEIAPSDVKEETSKSLKRKKILITGLIILTICGFLSDEYQLTSNIIHVFKNEYCDLAYYTGVDDSSDDDNTVWNHLNAIDYHVVKKKTVFDQTGPIDGYDGTTAFIIGYWDEVKTSCFDYIQDDYSDLIMRDSPLTDDFAQIMLICGYLIFAIVNILSIVIDLKPKWKEKVEEFSKIEYDFYPPLLKKKYPDFKINIKYKYLILIFKSFTMWTVSVSLLPLKGIKYEKDCATSSVKGLDVQSLSNIYYFFTGCLLCSILFIYGGKWSRKKIDKDPDFWKKWWIKVLYYCYYLGFLYLFLFCSIGIFFGIWMSVASSVIFNFFSIGTTGFKVFHDFLEFF